MGCLLTFLTFWEVELITTNAFFLLFHTEIQLFCLISGGVGTKEQAESILTNI